MEKPSNLDRYLRVKREYKLAKRQADDAYHSMRSIERDLVEEMQSINMTSCAFDDVKVHLRRFQRCSVTQENEGQVREWLRHVHGDDHSFDRSVLSKPAIEDWVKEVLETGRMNETELPDFLGYKAGFGAVVTEAKE